MVAFEKQFECYLLLPQELKMTQLGKMIMTNLQNSSHTLVEKCLPGLSPLNCNHKSCKVN